MNLPEFFNSDAVTLPREGFQESTETFGDFLTRVFRNYIEAVERLDDPTFARICSSAKSSIDELTSLSTSILNAAQMYLSGYPHSAYDEVARSLDGMDWASYRSKLTFNEEPFRLSDPFSPYLHAIRHPPLYRIRCERAEVRMPTRNDIFHVPFQSRRLVANQRYSISGLPSLYLGSSIWICWEELGRPALDSVMVSRFRLVKPVTVFDLQFPPHQLWRLFEALLSVSPAARVRTSEEALRARFDEKFLIHYILRWPLLAACSLRPQSKAGSFFPEYIVPQLLLQWVTREKRVDGIRFFSVHVPSKGAHLLAHSNCVFPVRAISSKGHCTYLGERFALTEPLPWELLTASNLGESIPEIVSSNSFASIQMSSDLALQYSQTTFQANETKLAQIEARAGQSRCIDA